MSEKEKIEIIPGTKPRRRRKKAWDKITPQKQAFINEVLSGTPSSVAVTKLNLATTPERAKRKGYDLVNDPKVQMALQERMNEMYPNLSEQVAMKIKYMLDLPVKFSKDDSAGLSPKEFLAFAEYLAKINGWEAVKKTTHLRANFNAPQGFKFPGEKS